MREDRQGRGRLVGWSFGHSPGARHKVRLGGPHATALQ